ncbi:hypothetical protein RJ641_020115 [Dillenia turbinata]|uniref:Uncharacterized protein n=1 Tax=Dillenia turbinata TaxID=194707 RepID=A0AAN8US49_9MAGN
MASSSSKKWACFISSMASRIYFILIIFQFPLFRVPCRAGVCTTPIEVTSSQILASGIVHPNLVKALLYPRAIAYALLNNTPIPSYDSLLKLHNLNNAKKAPSTVDLRHFEVLVGCYLSTVGAILGLLSPGRISLFGVVLIMWGLLKEAIVGKPGRPSYHMQHTRIYPAMYIAAACAFLSIRGDVRKILRNCRRRRIRKSLVNSL